MIVTDLANARFIDRINQRGLELALSSTGIDKEPYNVRLSVDGIDFPVLDGNFPTMAKAQAVFNSLVRNFFNLCSYDEDNTK